jgi:hypothetical protein
MNALLCYFAKRGQRKYLKSTAIRQNGSLPVHKLMKTTHVMDQLIAGTDVKMVSIGKLNLTVEIDKLGGRNTPLNGCASSYVHKNGGLDISVDSVKNASAGATFFF